MLRIVLALLACVVIVFTTPRAKAVGPWQHARNMQQSGFLFHDLSAGRENVYMDSGSRFGARMRARAAWRKSPGHRANLPMFGLRVSSGSNGTYVVGR